MLLQSYWWGEGEGGGGKGGHPTQHRFILQKCVIALCGEHFFQGL